WLADPLETAADGTRFAAGDHDASIVERRDRRAQQFGTPFDDRLGDSLEPCHQCRRIIHSGARWHCSRIARDHSRIAFSAGKCPYNNHAGSMIGLIVAPLPDNGARLTSLSLPAAPAATSVPG